MNVSLKTIGFGFLQLLLFTSSREALAKDDNKKSNVVDLNQIDLEQVSEDWDGNTGSQVNVDRGMKIKDIIEPTNEYTYASFGRPDPFTQPSSLFAAPSKAASPLEVDAGLGKEIAVTSPLQKYPVTALKVKGIWQRGDSAMRAVVLTPKNEGIVVKIGDPISSGKVLQIDKESVIVRLYLIQKSGQRTFEDKRLTFAGETTVAEDAETIKLTPGKDPLFPGMQNPADVTVGTATPVAGGAIPGAPAPANPFANPAKPAGPPPAGGIAGPAAVTQPVAAPPANGGPAAFGWPYNNGAQTPPKAPASIRPGSAN